MALVTLLPGVVTTGDFKNSGTSRVASGVNTISANGRRLNQNQLTIDGVSAVDSDANGGPIVSVSLDAMREFKILTGILRGRVWKSGGIAHRPCCQERHIANPQRLLVSSPGGPQHQCWISNGQGLQRPL